MSNHLQPGYHPDADQIGAFLEQALPEHERAQVLDHLAVCPECREIVALSLPETEIAPQTVVARPARWWKSWTLAWPAAGLAAAAALVLLIAHRATPPPVTVPDRQQIAATHVPPAPAPNSDNATLPESQSPTPKGDRRPAISKMKSDETALALTPAAPPASVGGPILTGRNFAALRQSEASFRAIPGGAAAPPAVANAEDQKDAPAPSPAPAPKATVAGGLAGHAPATPQMTAKDEAATVAVSAANGAELQATPAGLAGITIAASDANLAMAASRLPSGLPMLSSAVQGSRIVAIDSAHVLFVSTNSGKSWKTVKIPCQGHAVRAALIQLPDLRNQPLMMDKAVGAGAGQLAGTPAAASAPVRSQDSARGSSISGTVKDRTGATIPRAGVTATNIATGTAYNASTDIAGRYTIDGLPSGAYRVEARASGFEKQQIASIAAGDAGPATANITLDVGAATETVTVQASSAQIDELAPSSQKRKAAGPPVPIFEITTENGEQWSSADGVHWTRM
jgi:hypothetical protein